MEILIIILLVVAAIVLLLVELFVIPGISLAGLAAGGCLIYANYYAFAHLGTTGGWITLAVSALACIGSLVAFMRSKTLDRIALKSEITSSVRSAASGSGKQVSVGDEGMTTTRLALIGYAEMGGEIVEVKSTAEFLDAQTPVRVVRIVDGIILVERKTA
ncbi:MAG: NfeD family protein [Bacteroides sp.]